MSIRSFLILGSLLLLPGSGMADMINCRFALHYKAKFSPTSTIPSRCDDPGTPTIEPNYSPNWNSTTDIPNPLPCTDYTVIGPRKAGTVYLVIGHAGTEGVAGVSFGVDYSGGITAAFVTWTTCADGLIFPNSGGNGDFPRPKGGVRITWDTQTSCAQQVIEPAGVHAVVGCFYIYASSSDQLKITPNNNLSSGVPELAVVDCANRTTDLAQVWPPQILPMLMGIVGVGGQTGYNPCLVTPAQETTWGKIKNKYN